MQLSLNKDLGPIRASAKKKVDEGAEAMRQLFVTPGSGQAMVYMSKEAQARACLTDPSPDPASYPLLACTIGIERHPDTGVLAQNVTEVAQIVVAVLDQWMLPAAAIEAARLSAKNAIDDASTPAQIKAAAAVEWASLLGTAQ